MGLNFLGNIVDAVGGYFKDNQQIKAAQKERSDELRKATLDAKLAAIKAGQTADIDTDLTARQSAGLMDDISFYLFLVPVPLAFIPNMVPHIQAGFAALEKMPQYYQITLGLMLVSVWGYRRLVIPVIEVIVKQWASRTKIKTDN